MMKTKTKKVKWLVVGMFVAAVSALSPASYLFYDDFENDQATTRLSGDDADPIAQVGSWSINEGSNPFSIQVINDASPGPASGNNYLSLFRPATGGFVEARANLTETTSSSDLEIGFDIYVPSEQTPTGAMYFQLYGGTPESPVTGISIQFFKTGQIILQSPGGGWSTIAMITTDEWANIRFHNFDFANNKFDLDIIDVSPSRTLNRPGFDFTSEAMDDAFRFRLYQGNNGAVAYIDDVYTAVPEPTTLLLLGAGATMLLRKRK